MRFIPVFRQKLLVLKPTERTKKKKANMETKDWSTILEPLLLLRRGFIRHTEYPVPPQCLVQHIQPHLLSEHPELFERFLVLC